MSAAQWRASLRDYVLSRIGRMPGDVVRISGHG